jgi:hypothetical protein
MIEFLMSIKCEKIKRKQISELIFICLHGIVDLTKYNNKKKLFG